MWNKKRVSVLLFGSLFLLTIIPSSFALLEGLYGYFYSPTDLIQLYQAWNTWIDFIVFFFIIASVSRLVFGRMFGKQGEEEHPGLKGLYVGMGLFGSLGLVLFGRYYGSWSNGILVSFGPIWFIFLLLLAIITIYRLAKGEEEKEPFTIGTIIFFLFLALFLGSMIYPNIFEPLLNTIFGNPIFALIFLFLLLLGGLSLLAKLGGLGTRFLNWRKNRSQNGGNEERPRRPEYQDTERAPTQTTPETPQPRRITVEIVTSPKSPYRIGQQITMAAIIREKSGWFGKREAIGNFACTWWINNIKLDERDQVINYKIPQDIINQSEQKVFITAEVIDIENPNRTARARDYMIIRSAIPSLTITKPIDTFSGQRNLRTSLNETLEFEYEISESHPQEIASARWFYLEGLANKPIIDNSILKKATAFQEGNNLKQAVGQVPLNLQAGKIYTIICIATNSKGKPYEILGVKKLLADYFTLEVKQEEQPQLTPKQKYFLSITKPIDREKSAKNPLIVNYDTLIEFEVTDKSKEITEIRWSLQVNHKTQASTDMIRDLGKGNKTSFVFQDKLPNLLPEGEYTLFAYGYINNNLVAIDYIWINLVAVKQQPQNPKFLLYLYDKNKKPLAAQSKDFQFKAIISDVFYFQAKVQNDKIENYNVEMFIDTADTFKYNEKQKVAGIQMKSGGKKRVTCIFRKGTKTLATITATILVLGPQQQAPNIEYSLLVSETDLEKKGEERKMGNFSNDTNIKVVPGKFFSFHPIIKNDDIKNYNASVILTNDKGNDTLKIEDLSRGDTIVPIRPPYPRKINFAFKKDKKIVKTIIITLIYEMPEQVIQSAWNEFIEWGKTKKYIGKSPPWLLFKSFLKNKGITLESLGLDQKTYDDITSKVWRRNSPK